MNINLNELLLQTKKVKFGENQGTPANVTVPSPETDKPQTGLNVLSFQGLNNITSNPVLATKLGASQPQQVEDKTANEYVAPYKSNIAFQGGKFKSLKLATIMALATLGAGALTSCSDEEPIPPQTIINVDNNVTINYAEDSSKWEAMYDLLKQLMLQQGEQYQAIQEQMAAMLEYMQQIMELMQQQGADAKAYYEQMFNFITTSIANQEIMITLLTQNGMSQEEANTLLQELIDKVESGQLSAADAMKQILDLLGDIKGLLGQVLTALEKAEEDRAALLEIANEIKNSSQTTNTQLATLILQNQTLIASNQEAVEKLDSIREAIEQANLDSNANFETVVKTLNMTKDQLISVMIKLGYTQAQIEQMTAAQIIAAIKENTQVTKDNNAKLQQILDELKEGRISAEEAAQQIIDLLGEINSNLLNLTESFNQFVEQYNNDKTKHFALMEQLVMDNKIQTAQLNLMQATQKDMAESLEGIKKNTDDLLAIASDDTRFNQLIEAIKEIQAGGSGNIDYQKLEDMFKLMGMQISDAINMSSSELTAIIKEFQETYIETEQKQVEELQTINGKLDDLQIFAGLSKDEIIMAIDKVTSAVNSGNANIYEELKNLEAQLDKLQAAIDAMYKAIGEQAEKVNSYLSKFDSKFDSALSLLSSIDTNMEKIMSNQTLANMYLESLNKSINDLKVEIEKIRVAVEGDGDGGNGSSITLDQLEELWKQHDEANYNRYKELLENLNITVDVDTTTIEDLLKEINNKMDGINDNSAILDQILDLLQGIDWTKPDYSDKLDRIIEILENFKCNCDCGNSNEGILGNLEDVLS